MFKKIADRYFAWERDLRDSFGDDISTPNGRFWAYVHFHLMDQAFFGCCGQICAKLRPMCTVQINPRHAG